MPGQAAGDNPGFIAPMLATPAAGLPPDAAGFVAEVKWDGLRACIAVAGGRVRAWSRNGRDITVAYPELGALAAVAGRRTTVLDGEIVALSGPRPDFTLLQRRMTASRPGAGLLAAVPVTLIIFDVLRSGREDLAGSPYVLRRALLEDLGLEVPGSGAAERYPRSGPGGDRAQASRVAVPPGSAHPRVPEDPEHPRGRGAGRRLAAWHRRAPEHGRFGAHGPAPAGRAGVRGHRRQRPVDGGVPHCWSRLEQPVSPFAGPLPAAITRQARWAQPVLAAEVTYLERTPSGRLRQPVWRGLRPG